MFLDLSDHEAATKHFVDGELRQSRVAKPYRAVWQARSLWHQVEQVVACLGVLGAAIMNNGPNMKSVSNPCVRVYLRYIFWVVFLWKGRTTKACRAVSILFSKQCMISKAVSVLMDYKGI